MIKSIFAVDSQGGLGKAGTLPWPRDPEDLRWFRKNTLGHVVVMGRNTWMDPMLPKPLPDRINVVVANQDHHACDAAHRVIYGNNLVQELGRLQSDHPHKTVWIIGGARLLETTWDLVQEAYITRIYDSYDCDVKIDLKDHLSGFRLIRAEPGNGKVFEIHERIP